MQESNGDPKPELMADRVAEIVLPHTGRRDLPQTQDVEDSVDDAEHGDASRADDGDPELERVQQA